MPIRGHLLGHPVEKFNCVFATYGHIRVGRRPILVKSYSRHGAREMRGGGQARVELVV